ncbi:ADP-ribosyl cyclase/cyclic ADP-ribose hydrolase-like isoform X2 [Halichondria panicea]|uniref:ADP-ribosyl cyclase/cyclic ADP-ribose hydrolase-like isoform X2 n=1 Tax=Halichondria panicea TaxID=6063 RepID=UPI00312B44E8
MVHMILLTLFCLLAAVDGQQNGTICAPSPTGFRDLFINMCTNLQLREWDEGSSSQCAGYWDAFSSSFANMDPSSVTTKNYEDYFDMFPITTKMDTFLFWSGTMDLLGMLSCMCDAADVFSAANYPPIAIMGSIAEQLGMMMAELRWCGTIATSGDGIKYTGMCECMVSYAFFQEFSVRFAKAARGTIFYLGNGESENGAFSEESFFAKHEIPYLKSDLTPSAVILVVHNNTVSRGSRSCGQEPLITLKNRLQAKNIASTCYDVYGYPINNSTSLEQLTGCTARIITSIQEGMEPADDDCFSKETSSSVPGQRIPPATIAVLAFLALSVLF